MCYKTDLLCVVTSIRRSCGVPAWCTTYLQLQFYSENYVVWQTCLVKFIFNILFMTTEVYLDLQCHTAHTKRSNARVASRNLLKASASITRKQTGEETTTLVSSQPANRLSYRGARWQEKPNTWPLEGKVILAWWFLVSCETFHFNITKWQIVRHCFCFVESL